MARKNPHIGSSFERWLVEEVEEAIREEVTAAAIKAVIARQLASEMKKKKITKQRMAELIKTSRTSPRCCLTNEAESSRVQKGSAPAGARQPNLQQLGANQVLLPSP